MTERIGIIGGTFDPIHLGHLFIAEESRYRCGLDRVIFVPAGVPPHKPGEPITAAERRYSMTMLATEDNPAFEVSRIEIERPETSYTVNTLEAFREAQPDDELFFIMGADSVAELVTWYRPERIVELATVIAAARPGTDIERAKEDLPKSLRNRVIFLESPGLHISSTALRARASLGMPLRYLLHDRVEKYIIENELYRNGS